MLFTRGRLALGETVMINSVGSGIGSAAVQLARLAGATVIGNASSDEKLARAERARAWITGSITRHRTSSPR